MAPPSLFSYGYIQALQKYVVRVRDHKTGANTTYHFDDTTQRFVKTNVPIEIKESELEPLYKSKCDAHSEVVFCRANPLGDQIFKVCNLYGHWVKVQCLCCVYQKELVEVLYITNMSSDKKVEMVTHNCLDFQPVYSKWCENTEKITVFGRVQGSFEPFNFINDGFVKSDCRKECCKLRAPTAPPLSMESSTQGMFYTRTHRDEANRPLLCLSIHWYNKEHGQMNVFMDEDGDIGEYEWNEVRKCFQLVKPLDTRCLIQLTDRLRLNETKYDDDLRIIGTKYCSGLKNTLYLCWHKDLSDPLVCYFSPITLQFTLVDCPCCEFKEEEVELSKVGVIKTYSSPTTGTTVTISHVGNGEMVKMLGTISGGEVRLEKAMIRDETHLKSEELTARRESELRHLTPMIQIFTAEGLEGWVLRKQRTSSNGCDTIGTIALMDGSVKPFTLDCQRSNYAIYHLDCVDLKEAKPKPIYPNTERYALDWDLTPLSHDGHFITCFNHFTSTEGIYSFDSTSGHLVQGSCAPCESDKVPIGPNQKIFEVRSPLYALILATNQEGRLIKIGRNPFTKEYSAMLPLRVINQEDAEKFRSKMASKQPQRSSSQVDKALKDQVEQLQTSNQSLKEQVEQLQSQLKTYEEEREAQEREMNERIQKVKTVLQDSAKNYEAEAEANGTIQWVTEPRIVDYSPSLQLNIRPMRDLRHEKKSSGEMTEAEDDMLAAEKLRHYEQRRLSDQERVETYHRKLKEQQEQRRLAREEERQIEERRQQDEERRRVGEELRKKILEEKARFQQLVSWYKKKQEGELEAGKVVVEAGPNSDSEYSDEEKEEDYSDGEGSGYSDEKVEAGDVAPDADDGEIAGRIQVAQHQETEEADSDSEHSDKEEDYSDEAAEQAPAEEKPNPCPPVQEEKAAAEMIEAEADMMAAKKRQEEEESARLAEQGRAREKEQIEKELRELRERHERRLLARQEEERSEAERRRQIEERRRKDEADREAYRIEVAHRLELMAEYYKRQLEKQHAEAARSAEKQEEELLPEEEEEELFQLETIDVGGSKELHFTQISKKDDDEVPLYTIKSIGFADPGRKTVKVVVEQVALQGSESEGEDEEESESEGEDEEDSDEEARDHHEAQKVVPENDDASDSEYSDEEEEEYSDEEESDEEESDSDGEKAWSSDDEVVASGTSEANQAKQADTSNLPVKEKVVPSVTGDKSDAECSDDVSSEEGCSDKEGSDDQKPDREVPDVSRLIRNEGSSFLRHLRNPRLTYRQALIDAAVRTSVAYNSQREPAPEEPKPEVEDQSDESDISHVDSIDIRDISDVESTSTALEPEEEDELFDTESVNTALEPDCESDNSDVSDLVHVESDTESVHTALEPDEDEDNISIISTTSTAKEFSIAHDPEGSTDSDISYLDSDLGSSYEVEHDVAVNERVRLASETPEIAHGGPEEEEDYEVPMIPPSCSIM